jgi:uncharacterized protein YcbK (DUF882 family)
MTRALCTAVFVCAIALSISTANASPRHQMPRNDSQALTYCASDQSYRSACPGQETRTIARRAGRKAVVDVNGNRASRRASVSRDCLTSDTRSLLDQAESAFRVTFTLVSTCRPGAIIAGTNHISEHAHGRAVDLLVPHAISKAAVVRWFYAHAKGVTMVYRDMPHVHFDTGPYHKLACGGCGKPRHTKMAHLR